MDVSRGAIKPKSAVGSHRIQYPDRLFRAKLIDNQCLDYSELWFSSPLLRSLITKNAKSSAGHQRISMGAITNAPIPVPPLAEQQRIVEIVHLLLNFIGNIKEHYQAMQINLDRLNQSILAKAFRGELVEQEPNDEPASVLLDRIRAERQAKEGKKSGVARGKRNKASNDQLDLPGLE